MGRLELTAVTILRARRRIAVVLLGAFAAVAAGPADARHYYVRHAIHEGGGSSPPYAAIVVDANSGAVLHAANPDELRHPASLTKIMTLYQLFERLETGKLKLDTPLEVSAHAAGQSPTKLGLRAGETIDVDTAIRGLVTRSANDAAVVIAEAIAGSEPDFANMMTHQAHMLGMSRTVYRNASGLPDDDQVTTARDQALLGRAIQDRFPKYYHYFSLPSFTFHGIAIRNHDNLLGRVEGVDGIKTGYTQASGFNLVTSVRRDNRHIVAVVMGGASAGARDARMSSLVEEYIVAAASQKTAPAIAEGNARIAEARLPETRQADARAIDRHVTESRASEAEAAKPAAHAPVRSNPAALYAVASFSRPIPWPSPQASATARPASAPADAAPTAPPPTTAAVHEAAAAVPNTDEPLRPIPVRTLKVKLPPAQVAELTPPVNARTDAAALPSEQSPEAAVPTGAVTRSSAPVNEAADPRHDVADEPARDAAWPSRSASLPGAPPQRMSVASPPPTVHSGWIIQVGAFEDERAAKDKLNAAQSKAAALAHADPFTEAVVRGDKTLYRARFAGLHRDEAESACRQLRHNDIDCITMRN
jgi:D-alanyl-D-alanine carboxypeptidase